MRIMCYFSDSGNDWETGNSSSILPTGVEPKTFRLLVRMLYHPELQETRGTDAQ